MKIIKILFIILGVLAVVVGAVLAYVAATFDPNAYKPQIIELVKERTQRTLKLDGDIKLAFWPGIGADLGRLSLSESKNEKVFMSAEGLRVSLQLMPLLSKRLVVDEVTVKGARINLVRYKNGKMSVDDLAGQGDAPAPGQTGEQKQTPFAFDISQVVIADSALSFSDEAGGAQYAISKLNLKTGRIAPGVPADVALALMIQGNQPKLNLAVDMKTRLTFDLNKKTYALQNLALELKGQAADISELVLKAGGSVSANMKSGEFAADKLTVAATGKRGKEAFDVTVDAPRLSFAGDKASGDQLAVSVKLTGPEGEKSVSLKSPVSGNLQARKFSLPQLQAAISASGPAVPGQRISGELTGSASVDIEKEIGQLDVAGKIADSTIKAQIGVRNFSPPDIRFNVEIDQLDVDKYLPAKTAGSGGSGSAATTAAVPEKAFDLSGLRAFRTNGNLRIGALKAGNVKAADLRASVKAANGRIDVNPLTANLYRGTLSGAATVNAAPAVPAFALKANLAGIEVAPLLKDLADNETLEGRGTVALDITTRGNTVSALKRALDGTASLRLADGALKGIDIAAAISSAKASLGALKGEQTQQADAGQKTGFSELTASFKITDGIARNNDLSMKSPLLRVGGEGEINIGADTINYLVKASIVGTSQGQGGRETENLRGITVPVRVTGALAAPSYKLDFGAMISDTAKQKVKEAVKNQLKDRLFGGGAKSDSTAPAPDAPKSGGSARDALKGLFGR
jgi:AsmA protein